MKQDILWKFWTESIENIQIHVSTGCQNVPELNKSKCIRENTENLRPKILNSQVIDNSETSYNFVGNVWKVPL